MAAVDSKIEGEMEEKSVDEREVLSATVHPEKHHRFITDVRRHDVMLGRGSPYVQFKGNKSFRQLVDKHQAEYNGMRVPRSVKARIAKQILLRIHKRRGRFLRLLGAQEAKNLGVSDGVTAWAIAHEEVALEKIKQALRSRNSAKDATAVVTVNVNESTVAASMPLPPTSTGHSIGHSTASSTMPNGVLLESHVATNHVSGHPMDTSVLNTAVVNLTLLDLQQKRAMLLLRLQHTQQCMGILAAPLSGVIPMTVPTPFVPLPVMNPNPLLPLFVPLSVMNPNPLLPPFVPLPVMNPNPLLLSMTTTPIPSRRPHP